MYVRTQRHSTPHRRRYSASKPQIAILPLHPGPPHQHQPPKPWFYSSIISSLWSLPRSKRTRHTLRHKLFQMRKLTNKKEQRQLTFAIAGGDGRGQTGEGGGGGGEEGGGLHWFLLVSGILSVSFVLGRLWRWPLRRSSAWNDVVRYGSRFKIGLFGTD